MIITVVIYRPVGVVHPLGGGDDVENRPGRIPLRSWRGSLDCRRGSDQGFFGRFTSGHRPSDYQDNQEQAKSAMHGTTIIRGYPRNKAPIQLTRTPRSASGEPSPLSWGYRFAARLDQRC